MNTPRRQKEAPLYLLVAGLVFVITLFTTGLQVANIHSESQEMASRQASQSFDIVYNAVTSDVHASINPILGLVNSSSILFMNVGLGTFQSAKSIYLSSSLLTLASHENINAVNYGFTDGTFFSVSALRSRQARAGFKAPADALYVVWAVVRERNGELREWRVYLNEQYQELTSKNYAATYDPRQENWFKLAMNSEKLVMTSPYIFTTSRELGMSCAMTMPNRAGVFSVNVTLKNMNDMLRESFVIPAGYLFLLDDEQRVVAFSSDNPLQEAHTGSLLPLKEVTIPEVHDAYELLKSNGFELLRHQQYILDNREYFLQNTPFMMGTQEMNLLFLVPCDLYTNFADRLFFDSTIFAIFAFLLTTPLVILLARRVSISLNRLVLVTERIASETTPSSSQPEPSCVVEVNQLGKSIFIMERTINDRNTALRQLMGQLETRVQERTGELNEARQRAEEASMAKGTFLATMSHEIRTPMNAIIGFIHLFETANLNDRQRDQLAKIRLSAESLLTIINDVLDFSKIEARRLNIEHIAFELPAVIDAVHSIMGQAVEKKKLELRISLSPQLPVRLVGDPTRLHQILLNLMSNAVKFTSAGYIALEVDLDPEQPEENAETPCICLRMRVSDTGIGIAAEHLEHLFKPFTQADQTVTRRFGGTGLGLVICKELAELMHGSIRVESTLGKGTTFTCRLLLNVATDQQAAVEMAQHSALEHLTEFSGARVLIVEDNEINQEIVMAMLEPSGLIIDLADNGRHCLELCAVNCYHAVLMDMQMPEMDGIEATRQLRTKVDAQGQPLFSPETLPVIAMTANAMSEDRVLCMEAGMNDFISKPITPDMLYRVLSTWLETTWKPQSPAS